MERIVLRDIETKDSNAPSTVELYEFDRRNQLGLEIGVKRVKAETAALVS